MTEAITTLTAGLQQAVSRVNVATAQIANPQNFVPAPSRGSSQASDFAGTDTTGSFAGNALEASFISLKVATQSYKANAEALTSILENQKEAFERIV